MPNTLTRVTGYRGPNAPRLYKEGISNTAGTSFAFGDFVKFGTGGTIQGLIDTTSSANNDGSSGADILGMVLRDDANRSAASTEYDCPVVVADDETEFFLPLWASSGTDAEYQDVSEGLQCRVRLQLLTTGWTYCADIAATTNPQIQLTKKTPATKDGEKYAGAWFKVLPTERAIR